MIGPAGPQGPLRGPYPGSSPPGQQMRGPMMANNAGPRPPYMGGPNQGPLRGPAGKKQSYSCLGFYFYFGNDVVAHFRNADRYSTCARFSSFDLEAKKPGVG